MKKNIFVALLINASCVSTSSFANDEVGFDPIKVEPIEYSYVLEKDGIVTENGSFSILSKSAIVSHHRIQEIISGIESVNSITVPKREKIKEGLDLVVEPEAFSSEKIKVSLQFRDVAELSPKSIGDFTISLVAQDVYKSDFSWKLAAGKTLCQELYGTDSKLEFCLTRK